MKSPPRPQDETPAEATEAQLRLYNTLTRRKEDFARSDRERQSCGAKKLILGLTDEKAVEIMQIH